MIVDSLMHRGIITLPATHTVLQAAVMMRDRSIGSVVVTDAGGAPIGIVTEGDLARKVIAAGLAADGTALSAIMSRPLATIEPSAQIEEAAERMRALKVKRLVVTMDGTVRGIITATDIAYAEPRLTASLMEGWVKSRWEG